MNLTNGPKVQIKSALAHVHPETKDEQKLIDHLVETSEMAESFAGKIGLSEAGLVLGLLHDFGKYSSTFQNYLGSATEIIDPDGEAYVDSQLLKGKIDHSSAGAQYVWRKLKKIGENGGQGELCGQILALCIASHHSGLIDCLGKDGNSTFKKRMGKSDELTHLAECCSKIEKQLEVLLEEKLTASVVKEMLRKIALICNWSGTGLPRYTKISAFATGMLTRYLFSCLIDADRINSSEFEFPWRKQERLERCKWLDWQIAIDRLESKLATFPITHDIDYVRRDIADNCQNRAHDDQRIFTLTVPTGGGKTLSSLRFALTHAKRHKLERIIYIVPFTSIIEQNAQAVRSVVEVEGDRFSWVLEHHSNLEPEQQTWRSKIMAENWDAPIVFTTMVQFLETFFGGGTRGVRRMHQLANSVLIFDEIQAIPVNCMHLFCNALNFTTQHAGTSAVLCTATQPLLNKLYAVEDVTDVRREKGQLVLDEKAEIVDNPAALFLKLQRVDVNNLTVPGGMSMENIASHVLSRYFETGSCLVVVNTKRCAKALYELCLEKINDDGALVHLSTGQYPAHRRAIIKSIKERLSAGSKKPVLCISTQLIEAGVDISFASVVRFLAGLDSIAQAAGRCNRSGELVDPVGRPIKGQVDIVNSDSEKIDLLTDIKEAQRCTLRILGGEFKDSELLQEDAMEQYFKYYLHKRSDDMVYPLKDSDSVAGTNLLSLLSTNELNVGEVVTGDTPKLPLLRQSFAEAANAFKAIDAPVNSIMVRHGGGVQIVDALCSENMRFSKAEFYKNLKKAQQFSVNVFPNVWQELRAEGAVHEIECEEKCGIYYLDSQYYSEEFGLSTEVVSSSKLLSI